LTATDHGICASGVGAIYYRVYPCDQDPPTEWTLYTGRFTIPDDCCHKIDMYAVDNLGNVRSTLSTTVEVDGTPPTMEPIAEPEDQMYWLTGPVFSNFGFDDNKALDDGWYRIDSDPWTPLFTDDADLEWNDDGWALPGFATLPGGYHTVYFRASDDIGNVEGESGEWSWSFYKGSPVEATCLRITIVGNSSDGGTFGYVSTNVILRVLVEAVDCDGLLDTSYSGPCTLRLEPAYLGDLDAAHLWIEGILTTTSTKPMVGGQAFFDVIYSPVSGKSEVLVARATMTGLKTGYTSLTFHPFPNPTSGEVFTHEFGYSLDGGYHLFAFGVVPSDDISKYNSGIYDYTAKSLIALGGKYCDGLGNMQWKIQRIEAHVRFSPFAPSIWVAYNAPANGGDLIDTNNFKMYPDKDYRIKVAAGQTAAFSLFGRAPDHEAGVLRTLSMKGATSSIPYDNELGWTSWITTMDVGAVKTDMKTQMTFVTDESQVTIQGIDQTTGVFVNLADTAPIVPGKGYLVIFSVSGSGYYKHA
jgi:hypothetical protein